ncbi:MAG: hypothetical protein ABI488_15155 [Polyangiaceae bacterium]
MAVSNLVAAKRAATARLMSIPGVVGVGVGPKVVNGRHSGELAIVVSVLEKLPASALPPDQLIPAEIDGFKTDVEIGGAMRQEFDIPEDAPYVDHRRFRKGEGGLRGGLEIRGAVPGTLGCVVTRDVPQGRMVFALSNTHVLNPQASPAASGGDVGQPDLGDGGFSDCCSNLVGKVAPGATFNSVVDAALARLDAGLAWVAEIDSIGPIGNVRVLTEIDLSFPDEPVIVKKKGRQTWVTRGYVRSVDHSLPTEDRGQVEHQIFVLPLPPFRAFTAGGDSGSLVVDKDNQPISLHALGGKVRSNGAEIYHSSAGAPITEVMLALNVGVASASAPGVIQIVPDLGDSAAPQARVRNTLRSRAQLSLDQARADFGATAGGKELLQVYQRHESEVRSLLNGHARVAAVWKRRRGAALGSRVWGSLFTPSQPLFRGLKSEEVNLALSDILASFERYGSPQLQADLGALRPELLCWTPLTYAQLLERLRHAPAETSDSRGAP